MQLFDAQRIACARQKAASTFSQYDFLVRAVEEEIKERVGVFTQPFTDIFIHGARTDSFVESPFYKHSTFLNDPFEEKSFPPLPTASFDLAIDCLTFHTTNDIQHVLKEYWRMLKPGGVFMAAFYGGETLRELRESLLHIELELTGGAALRVIPMIDLQTSLALLQATGFKEPITDREINTISYSSLHNLLNDIKGMGEHQPFADPPAPLSYRHFRRAEHYYQQHYSDPSGKLFATAEIIYMHGMK